MSETKFYDWNKTYSYGARLTMVVSARGRGKTYGLRRDCVRRYLKTGRRFCEFVRYRCDLAPVSSGWADKLVLNNEFPDYIFRTDSHHVYISKRPEREIMTDENGEEVVKEGKPRWEVCGYFADIYGHQNYKTMTFSNVGTVLFDEFVLDPHGSRRYVPEEYAAFIDLLDTVNREVYGETEPVRVFLMGNTCSICNPYFLEFGITKPRPGYTRFMGGYVLLHYDDSPAYSETKRKTLVGVLGRGHNNDMIENTFSDGGDEFIEAKPKRAKFFSGFLYEGRELGIWIDYSTGLFYANRKIPTDGEVFVISARDMSPDYELARKAEPRFKNLGRVFYNKSIRFSDAQVRADFVELMRFYGVR